MSKSPRSRQIASYIGAAIIPGSDNYELATGYAWLRVKQPDGSYTIPRVKQPDGSYLNVNLNIRSA